jgi:dihydropteroate synthase
MGILNITPDSFYSGSRITSHSELLGQAETMILEGADILDVGGMSTRPGASEISETEERQRLLPALRLLRKHFPSVPLSVDTYRGAIAREAALEGASIINDISGGQFDPDMFRTIADLGLPYVLMHTPAKPATMQDHVLPGSGVDYVFRFFTEKLAELEALGVNDVILDPGFGFGKTLEQNYALLKALPQFHALNCPLLVGLSRKSMINKVANTNPENALNGSTALHAIALINGAQILRVHDVKAAKETIALAEFYRKSAI